MKWTFLALLVFFGGMSASAQSNRPAQPTSLQPNLPTKVYSPKVSRKKKSKGPTYEARDKFYDRMEVIEKSRRKSEKKMMKPQYSNFQYFGHKKQPKKRPPEKMKYCKICGIRH